jgi:hypothetical protein
LSRTGTRTARSVVRTLQCEVGAAETCLVRRVHDDAEVADESWRVLLSRQVKVDVAVESKLLALSESRIITGRRLTSQRDSARSYCHACQTNHQPDTCPAERRYKQGTQ